MALSFDPQILAAIEQLPPAPPPLPAGEWRERRRCFDAMTVELNARLTSPQDVEVSPARATAADGTPIDLRVYRPSGETTGGLVLYLHGGGHFCCDIDASDPSCRAYASSAGVVVVSVDYRFAPEHPYPTALEDAYAALAWVAASAAQLGGDPARLAVMGDSAGGGMAAGVTLMARDRGGPPLARQVLIYPMLDDRTTGPDAALEPFLTWTFDDNITGWQALLGDRAGAADVPAYAAPARAADLSGLPPAYIEVGQLDAFCDEDVAYAMRLSRAGVDVELHVHPGAPHDFELLAPDSDVTRRAAASRTRVLAAL
jgi:acetyl esterase/lipase